MGEALQRQRECDKAKESTPASQSELSELRQRISKLKAKTVRGDREKSEVRSL
jgi:hypothetical protein